MTRSWRRYVNDENHIHVYALTYKQAGENYISGNYQGSLLTMKSRDAIIWGLILKFGNLALVVMVRMS